MSAGQSTDRWVEFDFGRHNAEVKQVWEAYQAGRPTRVPVILSVATRYYMLSRAANPDGLTFSRYLADPDTMFDALLRFQRWNKFNLLQDYELGLPEKWGIWVDFQNFYEAAWFGCQVHEFADQVPDTMPDFHDAPERVLERGLPEPFGGLMARVREYYDRFRARARNEQYLGRPIEVGGASGAGTDGVMTVACNLFGPDVVSELMAGEPERLHRLFEFITRATMRRMRAFRDLLGLPPRQDGFGFADDSIALISTAMYRDHVLPYHRQLCAAFATDKPRSIHLCGDATRHFKTLQEELNIQSFDTGFPVDFDRLRRELGPQARIQGGPHIEFLRTASPAAVRLEVRRILGSGVLEGGLFGLREGNNLAPHTPLANTEALYQAGREFGWLDGTEQA